MKRTIQCALVFTALSILGVSLSALNDAHAQGQCLPVCTSSPNTFSGNNTFSGTTTFTRDVMVDAGFSVNGSITIPTNSTLNLDGTFTENNGFKWNATTSAWRAGGGTAFSVNPGSGTVTVGSGYSMNLGGNKVLTGPVPADTSYGALSFGQSSLAFASSNFYSNGTDLFVNAPSSRSIIFRINNSDQQLGVNAGGVYFPSIQAITVNDNGAGTNATSTLTPARSMISITCNDANGCDITMGESGISSGALVHIINISTGTVNFADTSGVSELGGAFAAGQYDSLVLLYVTDRWVELGRSNN